MLLGSQHPHGCAVTAHSNWQVTVQHMQSSDARSGKPGLVAAVSSTKPCEQRWALEGTQHCQKTNAAAVDREMHVASILVQEFCARTPKNHRCFQHKQARPAKDVLWAPNSYALGLDVGRQCPAKGANNTLHGLRTVVTTKFATSYAQFTYDVANASIWNPLQCTHHH